VVVGVSASGSTPFVVGALAAAAEASALTAAVTARTGSPLAALVDHPIEVPVGDEVVSVSTRLKAGTAQKVVLNAFSTALMVRRGRTVGSLMGGMRVSNTKLRARAMSVCVQATGCDEDAARTALVRAGWQLDAALVMLATGADADEARERRRGSRSSDRRDRRQRRADDHVRQPVPPGIRPRAAALGADHARPPHRRLAAADHRDRAP
jgi:N-acetylmuramic acid 6-phosphate etherase